MKILKQGSVPVYKGTCKICGTEFEASHNELRSIALPAIPHYSQNCAMCPTCGENVSVAIKSPDTHHPDGFPKMP